MDLESNEVISEMFREPWDNLEDIMRELSRGQESRRFFKIMSLAKGSNLLEKCISLWQIIKDKEFFKGLPDIIVRRIEFVLGLKPMDFFKDMESGEKKEIHDFFDMHARILEDAEKKLDERKAHRSTPNSIDETRARERSRSRSRYLPRHGIDTSGTPRSDIRERDRSRSRSRSLPRHGNDTSRTKRSEIRERYRSRSRSRSLPRDGIDTSRRSNFEIRERKQSHSRSGSTPRHESDISERPREPSRPRPSSESIARNLHLKNTGSKLYRENRRFTTDSGGRKRNESEYTRQLRNLDVIRRNSEPILPPTEDEKDPYYSKNSIEEQHERTLNALLRMHRINMYKEGQEMKKRQEEEKRKEQEKKRIQEAERREEEKKRIQEEEKRRQETERIQEAEKRRQETER